jgi:hypothetical protein
MTQRPRLRARRQRSRCSVLDKGRRFLLLYSFYTGSVGHQAPYPTGDGTSESEVQRPEREAGYSPQSSAEGKNARPQNVYVVVLNNT